jgi:hypothetical protein
VLMSGGATRHGMAVAGGGSAAACTEFMQDFNVHVRLAR